MTVVFDSYAWIEFFIGSKKGEKVKELINKEEEIITPSIVLAEIANKYYREDLDEETIKGRIQHIQSISSIKYIDDEILKALKKARETLIKNTKKQKLTKKPGLGDFLVYATAIVSKAKIVTGDPHFKGLDIIYIGEKST